MVDADSDNGWNTVFLAMGKECSRRRSVFHSQKGIRVTMSNKNSHYIFRRVNSDGELKELHKILSAVYDESGIGWMLPRQKNGEVMLDAYDDVSYHLGIFFQQNGTVEPVGYVRIVNCTSAAQEGITPMPMSKYFPDSAEIDGFSRDNIVLSKQFVESTRMSVHPNHRIPRLFNWLIDGLAAWGFLCNGIDVATTCSHPVLKRVYQRIGFHKIEGTRTHRKPVPACALATTFADIPEHHKPDIKLLAEEFRATGCFTFFPRACVDEQKHLSTRTEVTRS